MRKKLLSLSICALILLSMTVVAHASWTSTYTAKYSSGENLPDESKLPYVRKTTSDTGNAILTYDLTSWTLPKAGIIGYDGIMVTVIHPVNNSRTNPICMTSTARPGENYSVYILGALTQSGVDTMKVSFDLDAEDPNMAR